MTKGKKYDLNIIENESSWSAQITRQVTSKKTKLSKEKEGFKTESAAKKWAEKTLLEFTSALNTSNKKRGEQRKLSEEQRKQRSSRRAEKTQKEKDGKLDNQQCKLPF